jgi:hypothetical protein
MLIEGTYKAHSTHHAAGYDHRDVVITSPVECHRYEVVCSISFGDYIPDEKVLIYAVSEAV